MRRAGVIPRVPRVACLLAVVATLMPLVGCTRQLAMTPNIYLPGGEDPFASIPDRLRTTDIELLYFTDRAAEEPDASGAVRYGRERSLYTTFGSTVVEIGDDVAWDTLVEQSRRSRRSVGLPLRVKRTVEIDTFPGTPYRFQLDEDGRYRRRDDVAESIDSTRASITRELEQHLDGQDRREVFMYIHGFKNSFEDAAFRAAEMWHFLGRVGVGMFYAWPAGNTGMIRGYNADRESGEFTVFHLKEVIRALEASPAVDRVHLIAHSRGTDVLMTALREHLLQMTGPDLRAVETKIGHVILAAPDLDVDVAFQRLATEQTFRACEQTTVYVCKHDRALGAAEWLYRSDSRVGRISPKRFTPREVNLLAEADAFTFVQADVTTGFMGHGYFLSNPAVSSDLIRLLRDGAEPGSPERPLEEMLPNYYMIRDGYGLPPKK